MGREGGGRKEGRDRGWEKGGKEKSRINRADFWSNVLNTFSNTCDSWPLS